MQIKLHRNVVQGVINGLKAILLDKKQADITVSQLLLSNKNWGARDRNFIASNIYDIVRFKRLYEYCCDEEAWGELALWRILGSKLIIEDIELPPWTEFEKLNPSEIKERYIVADSLRKIRESIPDWLDVLGEEELGANWDLEIAALNQQAKFSIRVNTLKTNKQVVKILLNDLGVECEESAIAPEALIINSRKNLRGLPAYKNGLFEVQDVSSQLVAPFLEVQPGMNVIDGCAGAGGKTLHLGALMQNQGEILAIDVSEKKLDELETRADRAGCSIIKRWSAEKLTPSIKAKLNAFADRILIDVPCSGLGVLRRKPDAKWSMAPNFIDEIRKTQSEILDTYAPMLKPGGYMVYSTCSILPNENELQVKEFIKRSHNFYQLETEQRISPAETGFDGFYMARIKRL